MCAWILTRWSQVDKRAPLVVIEACRSKHLTAWLGGSQSVNEAKHKVTNNHRKGGRHLLMRESQRDIVSVPSIKCGVFLKVSAATFIQPELGDIIPTDVVPLPFWHGKTLGTYAK